MPCGACLQHHDPHKLNYAAAAKEEMHEIATSPHSVKLVGKHTGVDEWDRVSEGDMATGSTSATFYWPTCS